MANGWSGNDPAMQNEPGVDYELATRYAANTDVSITAIRVWGATSSENVVGRTARIWSTGGSVLASVAIDASLPSGWTVYTLAAPLLVTAGTTFDVSYGTLRYYGAISDGYPKTSADLALTATQGRFHATPGSHPNSVTASFYGVDVVYDLAGNLPPEITALTVTTDGLEVTATAVVDDETPASVALSWDWGDGDTSTTGAGVLEASHTYDAAGVYAMFATAQDSGGLRHTRAAVVIVRANDELFDLLLVVGELADRLRTISGLRVSEFGPEAKRLNPPHAVVTLPTEGVVYHETYNSGGAMVTATVPVVVAVGKVHSPSAYSALAGYAAAGGVRSVRAVLESGVYVHVDTVVVADARFDEFTVAGDAYLVAVFDVEVSK